MFLRLAYTGHGIGLLEIELPFTIICAVIARTYNYLRAYSFVCAVLLYKDLTNEEVLID